MDLRPAEVTSILKAEIENYQGETSLQSVGTVLSVGDGVARVYGLEDCMMNELVEFGNGVRGVALNLEEDNVGAVLLEPSRQRRLRFARRLRRSERGRRGSLDRTDHLRADRRLAARPRGERPR